MKFEKVIDELGKAKVYMNLEGLDIGLSGVPNIKDYFTFRTDTYLLLKANATPESWDVVFGIPHDFLGTMKKEHVIEYCKTITMMHYRILKLNMHDTITGNLMTDLESDLSALLVELDDKINLIEQLYHYTETTIPIQSFEGVGERAQDSDEMTFHRKDVIGLTTIAVLCKMLSPIYGVFLEFYKKKLPDNVHKELHAYAILKRILAKHGYGLLATETRNRAVNHKYPLVDKVSYFIRNIINHLIKIVSATHIFNGYTLDVILQQIIASLYVRRFVSVELLKNGGNLITYMTSCARAAAQTQFAPTGYKTAVAEMIPPKEYSDEDGNMSMLEEQSRSSTSTADLRSIVKLSVVDAVEKFIVRYELDRDMVDQATAYYAVNHVEPSEANTYILSILFGKMLGGAKALQMIDVEDLVRLVALAQVYFIKHGYLDLVHVLSIANNHTTKINLNGSEASLKNSWSNSDEYRRCDNMYPVSVNEIRWDTRLEQIITTFTERDFRLNTAPNIWQIFGQESANGMTYIVPETFSRSVCTLVLDTIV